MVKVTFSLDFIVKLVIGLMVKYCQSTVTYCGVIGCHIEKNFRGTSAGHVSVAVPHTGDHVGLTEICKENKISEWKLKKECLLAFSKVTSINDKP